MNKYIHTIKSPIQDYRSPLCTVPKNLDSVLEYHNSPLVLWLHAYWWRDFKIGHIRNFRTSVTLTLTLDRVILQSVVYHSSTSVYISNFDKIGKNFLWLDGHTDIETGFSGLLRVDFKTCCLNEPLTGHQKVLTRCQLVMWTISSSCCCWDFTRHWVSATLGRTSAMLARNSSTLRRTSSTGSGGPAVLPNSAGTTNFYSDIHQTYRQTDGWTYAMTTLDKQSQLVPPLTTPLNCCRLYVIHINQG